MRLRRPGLLLLSFVIICLAAWPAASHAALPATYFLPNQPQTAPTARSLRVAIQVGHYKNNELPIQLARLVGSTGTYGGGRSEVDLNLDIANRVTRLLRAGGLLVDVLPATVPTGYSADVFVAIHADGSSSSAPRGFKISTRWSSKIAPQDATLVEAITSAYAGTTGLPEDSNVTRNMRGYYAYAPWRPNYRVSNFTPGAIVEMGYMTSPADRAVIFNAPDKVASGIASGITNFLKAAYPQGKATSAYGYGLIDNNIDPTANPTPIPTPRPGARPTTTHGNWQIYLMGQSSIKVYSDPGSGTLIGMLLQDQLYHSTTRHGDYYNVTLPDGKEGWVHRNAVVVQMQ